MLVGATSLMLLRANEPIACDSTVPLRISAAPAIAPALQEITSQEIEPGCVEVMVVSQTAGSAARAIAAGDSEAPALWVPDSALWPPRAAELAASSGLDAPTIEQHDPLVITPLVVVTASSQADRLGRPGQPVGWQDLVSGPVPGLSTTIGDPLTTTEGLATLTAVRGLLGNPDGTPKPELVGAMLQVGRETVPSIQSAYDRLSLAAEPLAFTATEQSVIAHNRGGGAAAPAVAMYPREGTIALEYPVVRVISGAEPPAIAEAAVRVEQALRSPAATRTLLAAGFRSTDGALDQTIDTALGIKPDSPVLLPAPAAEQATDVLRMWSAVTLDSRMLVVIDVSGSMDADAGNGRSRIELARDASDAALSLFPDSTSIGLWAFSIAKSPPDDWVELVPIGPLSDQVGDGTRREAMLAAARDLPSTTGGGTALNDTALAAFRTVRDSYEAGKVNSVVLMTDGRNEDEGSIDTNDLLRTLRDEFDPARPVPIITIGLGPEVDFEALQQISAATGGKAYLTRHPADIRGVFLDALIQRQCRPNC